LTLPVEEVVACYGKRWRIETDLHSLKQTVRLQQLCVHSADMADKELLVAVLGYNLVRTIMYLAAQRSGADPRQLSFTYACNTGIDQMKTTELESHLQAHWEWIQAKLLAGSYVPSPVRRVEIPKPNGGTRI
jgi:hypothetical protein